jgi:hypothetical protein
MAEWPDGGMVYWEGRHAPVCEATTVSTRSDDGPRPNGPDRSSGAPRQQRRLRRQNRVLGLLLAGIAVLVLITAVGAVMVLHNVETHHLFSGR